MRVSQQSDYPAGTGELKAMQKPMAGAAFLQMDRLILWDTRKWNKNMGGHVFFRAPIWRSGFVTSRAAASRLFGLSRPKLEAPPIE